MVKVSRTITYTSCNYAVIDTNGDVVGSGEIGLGDGKISVTKAVRKAKADFAKANELKPNYQFIIKGMDTVIRKYELPVDLFVKACNDYVRSCVKPASEE